MKQQFSPDVIGVIRQARRFCQVTALTVIATLLTHISMPTAVAAREAARKQAVEASLEPSARAELGEAVQQAQTLLERLRAEFERSKDERDPEAIERASEQLGELEQRLQKLDEKDSRTSSRRPAELRATHGCFAGRDTQVPQPRLG